MTDPLFRGRWMRSRIEEALADTRVVVLQGARQTGKSTLAEQIAGRCGGRVVTLDDSEAYLFASSDPAGFVAQYPEGLLVIDEIQRVPELMVALKAQVDRDRRPGRFLVTGSANLLDLPAVRESLAGRVETLVLHSFSQGELAEKAGSFPDAIFAGETFLGHRSALTRADYIERVCAGGYPEALTRRSARRRMDWYDAYLNQIVRRDAADISGLHRLGDLPRILRSIAARSGSGLVWTSLAGDLAIPRRTLEPYVRLLETLYLIHLLPAWSVNISSREVKQQKAHLLDTGLAVALLALGPAALVPGVADSAAGGLLEGFVAGELRRQLGWSDQRASLAHYRDARGAEVDVVMETPDGRVVGVEVKAAATVQAKDVKGLATLRDHLGERFIAGVVLYTGPRVQPIGERLTALPIDVLWQGLPRPAGPLSQARAA